MKPIKLLYYFPLNSFLFFFKNSEIKIDVDSWGDKVNLKKSNNLMYNLTHYPEFRSLIYYRIQQKNMVARVLVKIFSFFYHPQKNLFIHTKSLGDGFFIEHGFSTIISADSIGDNFHVNQNTTVGWSLNGAPVIKNNVTVGCNAVVIGKIIIENNVIIGAGSVVTKSIPENCVVVGNPARIIKRNGEKVNLPL